MQHVLPNPTASVSTSSTGTTNSQSERTLFWYHITLMTQFLGVMQALRVPTCWLKQAVSHIRVGLDTVTLGLAALLLGSFFMIALVSDTFPATSALQN